MRRRPSALSGAVAGLAGTAAMSGVIMLLRRALLPPNAAVQTHPERIVEWAVEQARRPPLRPQQVRQLGALIHFGYGALWGAIYARLFARLPPLLGGPALGAGLWLFAFPGWMPALGIHKPPLEWEPTEIQFTAAAHLTFGFVTALVIRGLHSAR